MTDLIQKYDNNTIWKDLVNYDFSNKNHRALAPLFSHIKEKLNRIQVTDGISAFYELKKSYCFYRFFLSLDLIVPNESKQWITTQNEKLWEFINNPKIKKVFYTIKKNIHNEEYNVFFKYIFDSYEHNTAEKAKIVDTIDTIKIQFEDNIKKNSSYYYFPRSKKHILNNFKKTTILKARREAKKKGWDGYYFRLNDDNVYNLLIYISDRETRKEVYNKFIHFMNTCRFQTENQKLLNKALILKRNLANAYGYNDYSHLVASQYTLSFQENQKIIELTKKQLSAYTSHYQSLMQKMLIADGFSDGIKPWDLAYYEKKLNSQYIVHTNLENFFHFDKTFPKILKQMEKIFQVSIRYSNTVNGNQVYEVKDKINKKTAYWILSPYAKKKETSPYEAELVEDTQIGEHRIPLIQIIHLHLNKNGKMSFSNIKDTLHEIGHAFHSFFLHTEKLKETIGWDLLELPSQFLENLAYSYDFLSKITHSPYLSKKLFKKEIKNYTFSDILYLNEKIMDFKTFFELNNNINPYSNKKNIKQMTLNRHSVGNYYNPCWETEHFVNCFERDYFSNYVYFFSESIAKQLNLIYKEKDFRYIFQQFGLDKKSLKTFIESKINITDIDLNKLLNYELFNNKFVISKNN